MGETSALLDDALKLMAEEGYANFSLATLATRTGVPLADIYRSFASRAAVIAALVEWADTRMTAPADAKDDSPARDRIFDVVMSRLDLVAPYKSALLVFARELPRVPQDAVGTFLAMIKSARHMLELAGVDVSGLKGRVRVQSLIAIYTKVMKVWVLEDDPGLPRTMATLDRWLRRAENLDPSFWG